MDERYHDDWAQEIAEGKLLQRTPFYRAPAYPFFLGSIYSIFGHGYYLSRLIGIIIGALSCVFVYLVGKEIFSQKVAVLSALLACFYGMFLYFDAMLLTTYLEVFFCLVGVFWTMKWVRNKINSHLIIAGLFWGLASVTRPNFLIFVPVFAMYVFLTFKRQSFRERLHPVLFLFIGIIPIVLIVMLMNILSGRDFVIIAWNGGINFFLGNNAHANGWSATSPELDATWWGGYRDAIIIAERALGQQLLPSQVSGYWSALGFEHIVSRPLAWLALMSKKVYLLFNAFDISNNQSIEAFKEFSPLLRIPLFNFGLILAFAIWGMICSLRTKGTKLIISFLAFYSISIVLFFVTARYRVPLVAFLLIYASYAVFWFFQRIRSRRLREVALPIIAVAAMIAFFHTDFYGTHIVDYSNIHVSLGNRFFDRGDYRKASEEYREALVHNPKNTDAMNALGNTYMMLKRTSAAKELFVHSLELNTSVDALCKLGILHLQAGNMDSAQIYLTDAIAIDTANPEVNYYLGMFYAYNEEPRSAIEYLEYSLQNYPDPKYVGNIHYNLARLYAGIGDREKAKQHLLRAGIKKE
jgi:Tfp pilus assembly protein PilF/4-amino-4-deoxy-L-arabinose transferase-like glycosyltransferase